MSCVPSRSPTSARCRLAPRVWPSTRMGSGTRHTSLVRPSLVALSLGPCSPLPATDPAICLFPDMDSGYYTVKFDSLLLKEAVVEGDSILPPLHPAAEESSSSDSSDTDSDGGSSYARGIATAHRIPN